MSGNAKGAILLHTRDFVLETLGSQGWERVLADLRPEDRVLFGSVVLHATWYPVAHWNRLTAVVLPRIGPDATDGMRMLAGYIAKQDLAAAHRLVLKLGSPEFMLRRTGQLWSRYFDAGTLTPEEVSPARWRIFLDAPRGADEAPDRFTCGPGVTAWVANGLQLSGTKARVTETRCRFQEGTRCEYEVAW